MKNLILFFLVLLTIFSCRKREDNIIIYLSEWNQPNSVRYGFFDNDSLFHNCTGVVLVNDSLPLDSFYIDPLGGIYYTVLGPDTFPVTKDTVYQDFELSVDICNNTYRYINYYNVLYAVEFEDHTIQEFQRDGAGVQSGYCGYDKLTIVAKSKKVLNVEWLEYQYE